MKRSWLSLVLSVCLSLVVIKRLADNQSNNRSCCILCGVMCSGGLSVSCYGQTALPEDGVGCTGTINGITSSASCKHDDGNIQ